MLWPKYLLGGFLQRGGGLGGAERGEGDSLAGGFRGIAGRWPDADVVLQGGMSEGLRDWDLWYNTLSSCSTIRLSLGLIAVQGSTHILFAAQPVTLHDRFVGTEDHRLFRGLRVDLDRGSCGNGADQAPRGQHVCISVIPVGRC